jgi:Zn-dependent peptidase ImmA (M78 family)
MSHDRKAVVNPHMIILGRESRGLPQKALAAQLNVTQGRISKMESGLLPVPDDLLERLARVLDYPKHFFYQEGGVTGIGIAEVFHRKRKSVPMHILEKVYAQIEIRIKNIIELIRSADISCTIPHLDIDEYDGRVEEIARIVRVHLQIPRGPIQDLTETLEDAGVIVIPFAFGTPLIDAISRWIPTLPPLFFVNQNSPKDRYRYSVAHELGHIVMHTLPTADMEEQANRFADEFLMPERDIRADLSEVDLAKLANLKRYWRVSMAALLMRAEELKAITPNQARYLWTQMGKAGYRTREPIELDVAGEQPSLLHELIETYETEFQYSEEDFRAILPFNNAELHEFYLRDHRKRGSQLRLVR